jgi:hypothetical protein
MTVKCNAITGGPASEPDWLPKTVVDQLIELKARNYAATRAVGPYLDVELEMPFGFVVATLVRIYREPLLALDQTSLGVLERLEQLRATNITASLSDLSKRAFRSANVARADQLITELLADLRKRPLAAELEALTLCLENLEALLATAR